MKVFVIDGSTAYERMFASLGYSIVKSLEVAELVCFTGGEDVTPALYGDVAHKYTGNNVYRDAKEGVIFEQCVHKKIPMVGICRGGQILNVLSGGRMYQHVEGHGRSHSITDVLTGETVYVSSTHHQMIMPSDKALLVASSTLGGEREWYDGAVFKKDISNQDIEVVFYPETQCLCFQPHPEFTSAEYYGMKTYFKSLLSRFFGG